MPARLAATTSAIKSLRDGRPRSARRGSSSSECGDVVVAFDVSSQRETIGGQQRGVVIAVMAGVFPSAGLVGGGWSGCGDDGLTAEGFDDDSD
jgi:hypothetical protein